MPQLRITGTKIKEFSGSNFRSLLHKRKSPLRDDLAQITKYGSPRYGDEELVSLIFDLLSFCLADLPENSSEARNLKGIPLLPLAPSMRNGGKVKIATFGMGQYIAASYKQV